MGDMHGARFGVEFFLLSFERLCGGIALSWIFNRANSLPCIGRLFSDLLEGRLARIGIELLGPCLVVIELYLLRLAQHVPVALLLPIHGPPHLCLRFAESQLVGVLTRGRRLSVRPVLVSLDNRRIVLGAAALVEKAIRNGAVTTLPVVAIQGIAVASRVLAAWSNMDLRLPVDPLLFQRAMIDAHIVTRAFERMVHVGAPLFAEVFGAPVRDTLVG